MDILLIQRECQVILKTYRRLDDSIAEARTPRIRNKRLTSSQKTKELESELSLLKEKYAHLQNKLNNHEEI